MNTVELIKDVRFMTKTNAADYSDSEIQHNINQEYKALQDILKTQSRVEWADEDSVIDLTMNISFASLPPNVAIKRVEVSKAGEDKFKTIKRTTYHDYEASSLNGCGFCGKSLTGALSHEGCTQKFIQTVEGIHVFPVPEDGMNVKIYINEDETIDWNDNSFAPRLPAFAHRLLTLKASMLYRDIEQVGSLEWIMSEYTNLYRDFMRHVKQGGKIINMKTKHNRLNYPGSDYRS